MKISSIVLALGLGLLVGGPAYLYTNDANMSVEFWTISAKLLMNDPMLFMSELPILFQGFLMTAAGALLTVVGVFTGFLLPSKRGGAGTIVKKIASPKGSKKPKSKKEAPASSSVDILDETIEEEKKSTAQLIKEKLSKKDEMSEFEGGIDEEEEKGPGLFEKLKAGMKKSDSKKEKQPKAKKTSRDEDKASGEQEMWQKAISGSIVDTGEDGTKEKIKVTKVKPKSGGLMSGFMSKISSKSKPQNVDSFEANAPQDSDFELEVKAWYSDVQRESKPKSELTQMAKIILDGSSEEMREGFVENNSIDGPFILRLLESWASRETFEEDDDEDAGYTDSKAALRAAVRAVKSGQKIEETDIPDDFSMDLSEIEEDESVDDEVGIEDDIELNDNEEEVISEQESVDENVSDNSGDDDETIGKISDIISEMKWLVSTARLVKDGMDEWPENLSTEDYRMEEVKAIEDKFSRMVFLFDDEEIDEMIENSDDENFAWLGENKEILEVGFEDFIRELIEDDEEEDYDEGSDDDSQSDVSDVQETSDDEVEEQSEQGTQSDEEEGDKAEPKSADKNSEVGSDDEDDSGQEEQSQTEEGQVEQTEEDEVEENNQDGASEDALAEALRKIEAESADVEDENNSDEEEASSEKDETSDVETDSEEDVALDEKEIEENSEEEIRTDDSVEENSEDTTVDSADVEVENTDEAEEEKEVEEARVEEVYVPKNLTQGDLEELSYADSLILQWGISSKSAGAGGGAMGRLIYSQSQEGLKPLGFVHMAATWKDRQGRYRLNVLFRYLEEGEWKFSDEDKYTVLNQRKDFIKVNPQMFEHKETKGMVNVICFHGPGAESLGDNLSEKIGDDVWVTNQIWDAKDIQASLEE